MDNLNTATALALIAQKHICLQTSDYYACKKALISVLAECLDIHDVVEVDVQANTGHLVQKMVRCQDGQQPELHEVVIWRNLENVDMSPSTRNEIITIFDQLERYNTLASRYTALGSPLKLGPYIIKAPVISLIVPILETNGSFPKLSQPVKDRFWFCQSYSGNPTRMPPKFLREELFLARNALSSVYASPEAQEYICSLLVFTRSHRLCSLAPLTTRPTLRAKAGILLLAKALVIYSNTQGLKEKTHSTKFVTPEYIKVAFRKIGYWLVDWETNSLFLRQDVDLDFQRRTEIAMLTGDWYGSEWEGVRRYLESHVAIEDQRSTTGFTNQFIEEVLETVAPPL